VTATVSISPDRARWLASASALVAEEAAAAINARGEFVLALAGGTTPRALYEHLATPDVARAVDWSRTVVLFGDERCVAPDDPSSNFAMARDCLLGPLGIDGAQVHRMRGEADPRAEATRYGAVLAELLGGSPGDPAGPARPIDLVLLGLGANAHTASLFPGLRWSLQPDAWVLAEYVEVVGSWRLTLTPAVLASARTVCFLVTGADKAAAVAAVLEGSADPVVRPAQAITSRSATRWLLDEEAAADLVDG